MNDWLTGLLGRQWGQQAEWGQQAQDQQEPTQPQWGHQAQEPQQQWGQTAQQEPQQEPAQRRQQAQWEPQQQPVGAQWGQQWGQLADVPIRYETTPWVEEFSQATGGMIPAAMGFKTADEAKVFLKRHPEHREAYADSPDLLADEVRRRRAVAEKKRQLDFLQQLSAGVYGPVE